MSYKAEILADSINPQGDRITTMKVTFPRMMLAEMNTHRMFSRNSASSRAIPFKKMVKMVEENPFVPIAWQKDHKGMQGTEYEIHEEHIKLNNIEWLEARDSAINHAKILNAKGNITKQLCNRLLEPFMWHTVIITATEFDNFFKLRCPQYQLKNKKETFKSWEDLINFYGNQTRDFYSELSLEEYTTTERLQCNLSQADIHIQAIAELMWNAYNESESKELKAGEWHIPFGDNISQSKLELLHYGKLKSTTNTEALYQQTKIAIAVARCARISYQTLGDNPKIDYKADIKLHDILSKSGHWSPFEHVAKAMTEEELSYYYVSDGPDPENFHTGWCRNFKGFIQYRSLLDD